MLILDVSQQALREICCEARTQPPNAIIIPWHSNWHGQNILQAHWASLYTWERFGRAELAGCCIDHNLSLIKPAKSDTMFSRRHSVTNYRGRFLLCWWEAAARRYCGTLQLARYRGALGDTSNEVRRLRCAAKWWGPFERKPNWLEGHLASAWQR